MNTSISDTILLQLAQQLREAADTQTPCSPLRTALGTEDIDAAYKIQHINNDLRIKAGARVMGRKIGLTSKAVQKQLGVDQPDYGTLLDTMEVLPGAHVSMQVLLQPKVEAEIAFVLKKDLTDPRLTSVDLISAIDYALPSIEIVGSRIADWNIKITDTIADNASASHFVLGHQPKRLDQFDVVNTVMSLHKNGVEVASGSGAACLGSPINATLWLARTMAQLGTPLQAGEVILSGALGPMAAVAAGDEFVATFSGLGSVQLQFTE